MIFLTFLFSIGTYYLIEKPLRFGKKKYIIAVLLVTMLAFGIFSLAVHSNP